jgi:hypothetical protein
MVEYRQDRPSEGLRRDKPDRKHNRRGILSDIPEVLKGGGDVGPVVRQELIHRLTMADRPEPSPPGMFAEVKCRQQEY